MIDLLFVQACGFATVNRSDWIGINTLVVLFSITIAAFIFALANFLPAERREKLKGIVNYEIAEGFLSLALITVLIVLASLACQAGGLLLGYSDYVSLFTSAENYIGNLLFINGLSLLTTLYTTSIQYTVVANLVSFLLNQAQQLLLGVAQISKVIAPQLIPNVVQVSFSINVATLFSEYAGVFTGFYGVLLASAFGSLFILLILLPIIEGGALTVIAPIALIFRSLAFFGPQLRKTANLLIAMAIGLYFILPLTVVMDMYVASCMGIGLGITAAACVPAYPFATSLSGYSVNSISPSLFGSQSILPVNSMNVPELAGAGQLNLPTNFYFGSIGSNLNQFFDIFLNAPGVTANYGETVAAYLFLSIVLVAVDMGITTGFIIGISKGLDSMSNLFGAGGFWRD